MDLNKPITLPSFGGKKKASTTASGDFVPSPPCVDLTPPAVRERVAAARARRVPVALVAVTVLGLGAAYANGFLGQSGLKSDLADAQSEQNQLAQDLAVYSPVTNLAAETNSLTSTVAGQTGQEVLHGEVYSRFVNAASGVGSITAVSLATGTEASGCSSTDPFEQTVLAGCLTFTVESSSGAAGASVLISSLTNDGWFTDPFIPQIGQSANGQASLSGTVGVTTAAFASSESAPDEQVSMDEQSGLDQPAGTEN